MLSVRPGQIWESCSFPGGIWREMEVVNVLANEVELRFLDMPNATDIQRGLSTTLGRMLSGSNGGPPAYRFVRA